MILTGTGADGSRALGEFKAAGGTVFAQDPGEAEYPGMPQAAIDTGFVDEVHPVEGISDALLEFSNKGAEAAAVAPHRKTEPRANTGLAAILAFLMEETAHDFRPYKPGTLERRIERRLGLLGIKAGDFAAYLAKLRGDPAEREVLASDLLINVTSFFRDPEVFATLEQTILPDLIGALANKQALRVWVAGCSTGEEAYSLAMACSEAITATGRDIPLQIFASDADPDAIATARAGLYPTGIAVPPDRLARFFIAEPGGFRVAAALRGAVVFTVQDLLVDPPLSRIDLISCRNLLIYLNPQAQAKVVALFDFALREGGVLVLGSAETVGAAEGRFTVISKPERLFRHVGRGRASGSGLPFSLAGRVLAAGGTAGGPGRGAGPPARAGTALARRSTYAEICERALIAGYAPAAVLINRKRQCLYSTGPTERFLRMAPGYATLDILALAPVSLRTRLRQAIDRAGATEPHVDAGRSRLRSGGRTTWFHSEIAWLGGDGEDLLLVCFVDEGASAAGAAAPAGAEDGARVKALEHELEATHAELDAAIRDRESESEEHKAINEEALSVNEEFQSTNEELLTSKEELQSLNEELTALNGQLQGTLERQRLTSDDLQNVLYATNVATLFLDRALKIRFFTPAITALFSIIAADVGRPLLDLRGHAEDPYLIDDARRVLADGVTVEREIAAPDAIFHARRIFPYRSHEGQVEGVVITYADVTERKAGARAVEVARFEAERANLAKSRFLAAASHDLRQPLQSLTLVQALLAQTVEGDKPQKLIARLGDTLGAMSGMLNALLDINQIEAGIVQPRPVEFAVSGVLDRLRGEFGYMAQARGLELRYVPSSARIVSDPRLLEQMIRNLLGNAIKYTRRGKILLGCRRRGNDLVIELCDTGIGIAKGDLRAIFEEFHQVGNRARDRGEGLGLGLSIVQRTGQLLGHAVGVRSVMGRGSVFTVTVPRAGPAAVPGGPAAVSGAAGAGAGPQDDAGSAPTPRLCKIVVVDDDPDVRELLEQMLKTRGHIVRTAGDGAAALALVAEGAIRPEILLTDYDLPGAMTGLDLLAAMRATLEPGLPGIILTGDISSGTLALIGAQDCVHFSKPVRPEDLAGAIERLVPAEPPLGDGDAALPVAPAGAITFVVDDDAEVTATIGEVLEADGHAVRRFASAEAFLAGYDPGVEGCLLVDANLAGTSGAGPDGAVMGGIALIEALRRRGDHIPAILMTGSSGIGLAVEAMKSGACDFIEKPVSRADLLASIARALGQSHGLHVSDAESALAARHVADLTPRQREVMDLVLAGHPSKNIAADLGISQRTIENHRAAVMQRMGARSLPELARMAQAAKAGG